MAAVVPKAAASGQRPAQGGAAHSDDQRTGRRDGDAYQRCPAAVAQVQDVERRLEIGVVELRDEGQPCRDEADDEQPPQ